MGRSLRSLDGGWFLESQVKQKRELIISTMDVFQKEFNSGVAKLLTPCKEDGKLYGRVCICCDRLVGHVEECQVSANTFVKYAPYLKGDAGVRDEIRHCYRVSLPLGDKEKERVLSEAMLSPRSKPVYNSAGKRAVPHLICCKECRAGLSLSKLKAGELPRFAIANGWEIGTAPECLTCLNEIEIALISQARQRAHLFVYWGGCHRSIKGWHTFYNTNSSRSVAVLNTVGQLTSADNISVVLCGPFTHEQKAKVIRKTEVSISRIRNAFKWLKGNNALYENEVEPTIGKPVVIDQSRTVESENSDIETKEQFTVVFPDGTVHTGGAEDGTSFEETVAEMKAKCPDSIPYLLSRPSNEVLRDYKDNNLMKAFPLQFPYGIGLPEQMLREKVSLPSTLAHLLYLSIPAFQEACFSLIVHNMFEKGRALNGSVWRVMGKHELCDVTEEEVNEAILRSKQGLPSRNGPGERFLSSVHTVKRNLAHSNEAAMSARSRFLSLTHHFGCPKALFTVSFDDGLDIRILA